MSGFRMRALSRDNEVIWSAGRGGGIQPQSFVSLAIACFLRSSSEGTLVVARTSSCM